MKQQIKLLAAIVVSLAMAIPVPLTVAMGAPPVLPDTLRWPARPQFPHDGVVLQPVDHTLHRDGSDQTSQPHAPMAARASMASIERSLAQKLTDESTNLDWRPLSIPRSGLALAYDSARGVTVLFEGIYDNKNATW
jgi:hypothetical protein